MNNRNYRKEMDNIISTFDGQVPTLLLHSCCAPCSSACLEMLAPFFEVTVLFYNPNITNPDEYHKRLEEERRFIDQINTQNGFGDTSVCFHPIRLIDGRYEPQEFFDIAKGFERCPEGGDRCFRCFELRLKEAAIAASDGNFDYFTTTLTISPLKNAQKLNEIGEQVASQSGVKFLPSDFKKKDGYKRSIQLSAEYDLYRQNFCGCIYSQVAQNNPQSQSVTS